MLQAAKTSSLLLGHTAVSFWQFDTVFETNVKKKENHRNNLAIYIYQNSLVTIYRRVF
jgi:hypothetical protein